MTARARDLAFLPKRPVAADPGVARMDTIERCGEYDRAESGCIRNRQGRVGEEVMTAQVMALGGELPVTFMSQERRHSRRCFVVAVGTYLYVGEGSGRCRRREQQIL